MASADDVRGLLVDTLPSFFSAFFVLVLEVAIDFCNFVNVLLESCDLHSNHWSSGFRELFRKKDFKCPNFSIGGIYRFDLAIIEGRVLDCGNLETPHTNQIIEATGLVKFCSCGLILMERLA